MRLERSPNSVGMLPLRTVAREAQVIEIGEVAQLRGYATAQTVAREAQVSEIG